MYVKLYVLKCEFLGLGFFLEVRENVKNKNKNKIIFVLIYLLRKYFFIKGKI